MNTRRELTDNQKKRLRNLESALRTAVTFGEYQKAKAITHDIQEILRPSGQETRLMQAKNWLFEAAMEAGDMDFATLGFQGVRKKVSPKTRLYLEATALLAICYLRKKNLRQAEPLMAEALNCEKNIRSERRRREFLAYLIKRFEEEGMIAALEDTGADTFDLEEIHNEAKEILQVKSEQEIYKLLADATPLHVIQYLESIRIVARRQLPGREIQLLANPEVDRNSPKLGKKIFASLKRVIWKSLCDPESDVYKMWFSSGMKEVFDKKYLTGAILAGLSGLRIGIYAMAVYTSALVLKMGLEVFCDAYKPEQIMISRKK